MSDRSDNPGIFGHDNHFEAGSFSDLFPHAEEVDETEIVYPGYDFIRDEPRFEHDPPQRYTDEQIDAAWHNAANVIPGTECTCTVLSFIEGEPCGSERQFARTTAEICDHCLNRLLF